MHNGYMHDGWGGGSWGWIAMAAFMAKPPTDAPVSRAGSAQAALRTQLRGVIAAFATQRGRQITLTMASADPESELA